MSTLNYPLLAIPAYYIFSVAPHAYSTALLTSHGYNPNNSNPKASLAPSTVKGKVPDAIFHKYQRAENAQSNNMEQMPLFVAAVLASLIAERATLKGASTVKDVTGLWTFLVGWFLVRSLYVVAYVQITTHQMSFLRSGLYMVGTLLAFWQMYKAASILG